MTKTIIFDLDALDTIDAPRIGVPKIKLYDVHMSDVLRWACANYPGRNRVPLPQAAAHHADGAHP